MRDFVHLHVHTEYSLLDGFARIDRLLSSVKEKGMSAVAITDHGTMFGVVDFYKAAVAEGLKPIIGCEVYLAPEGIRNRNGDRNHLILLVKNRIGYQNLCKLCSIGFTEGFYYKPRVDADLLAEYAEGLICLSGCKSGPVSQAILSGDLSRAADWCKQLKKIYRDDFYLELQNHGLEEEKRIIRGLVYLSKELDIPVAATNDVHYISREDAKIHDILLCIQTNKSVSDQDRMRFPNDEFYLKNPDEMEKLFSSYPEAIENTVRIAEKCSFELDFNTRHLPKFAKEVDLRELCYSKMREKQKQGRLLHEEAQMIERLEYELRTIEQMGYSDYMLIVQDFIHAAREKSIAVGPGRGSAGGSFVAYLLDITEVDPLKYQLIFERFLNPERISMPDIDVDFEDERRGEVIDYVKDLYGEDRVSHISTFGTFAARAAIRDVGRVLGYPGYIVDKLAREIPVSPSITLEAARRGSRNIQKMLHDDGELEILYQYAIALEGMPRHVSTHAAGIVMTENPVRDYVPLYHGNATQYTMGALSDLGLLKMDFLGIRTLSVVKHAVELIQKSCGETSGHSVAGAGAEECVVDIDEQREEVFHLLQSGNTVGLFQLESTGFRRFLKKMKPNCFEDIVAAISLYRPGPMQSIPAYLENRKKGWVEYEIPELCSILDSTHGVVIYQEQVMQIARDLAGYSYGRSDVLRSAMSKKNHGVMGREKPIFVDGLKTHGVDVRKAEALFDELSEFANYAFNKTHAVGYSILAYRTAYLKTFYPLHFMVSLLTSVQNSRSLLIRYINECRRMGIELLPPSVNESGYEFLIEDGAIRWSLVSVKHVGQGFARELVKVRTRGEFRDFYDFVERMPSGELRKNQLEALILVGAFDCMGYTRTQLMEQYEQIIKYISGQKKEYGEHQLNFFGSVGVSRPKLLFAPEFEAQKKAGFEKEYLGLYLRDHPLSAYMDVIAECNSIRFSELSDKAEEDPDSIDGLEYRGIVHVSQKREQYTKKGDLMAYFICDDGEGEIEAMIFPSVYTRYTGNAVIFLEGKIQSQAGKNLQIVVRKISPTEACRRFLERKENPLGSGSHRLSTDLKRANPGRRQIPHLHIFFSAQEKEKFISVRRLLETCRKMEEADSSDDFEAVPDLSELSHEKDEWKRYPYRVVLIIVETKKQLQLSDPLLLDLRDMEKISAVVGKQNVKVLFT